MFPETANPWSGSAGAPRAMRIPEAPTEKSPETGSAVWIPRNSVRRMPSRAASHRADNETSPAAMRRFEIPTVGGCFAPGRRQAPVDPVPTFLPQKASARSGPRPVMAAGYRASPPAGPDAPKTSPVASRVVAVKEMPEQGPAVVIDAGVNVLPTAYWYDHPIEALDDESGGGAGKVRPTRVYGPLCMQIDVVRDRAPLPPLKVGAPLVIANVGAYCVSQSMQFIQPRPAVVLLGPGEPEVVRRRETWRDIFALDHVPERLRRDGYAL